MLLAGMTIAISISFPLEASPGSRSNQPSVVIKLAGLFKKRVRSGGTRSDSVCVVTPDLGGERQLWSDRPVIVWREGNVARVQVRLADSKTLVWEQILSGTQTSATYSGAPLQPGQTYEVMLLGDMGKNLVKEGFLPQFVLLSVATRTSVSEALNAKEHQLSAKQGTAEEIVVAKVQYLLDQNLTSDAFQLLYTTKSASPELKELTQQIVALACDDKPLSASSN